MTCARFLLLFCWHVACSDVHEAYDHVAYAFDNDDASTPAELEFFTTPPAVSSLNYAIYQNTTLIGLENMGPVRVFCDTLALGVPSFTKDNIYAPYTGLTIVVPAGAWLTSERRGGKRDLTISVFEVPAHLHAPSLTHVAGPAIDLGPHDQRLQKAIYVQVPLYHGSSSAATVYQTYVLDPVSLLWTTPQTTTNRSLSTLGAFIAMAMDSTPDNDKHPLVYYETIVIACTIAGIFLILLCLISYAICRHTPTTPPLSNLHATVAYTNQRVAI